METRIYDASGRDIRELKQCNRCGQMVGFAVKFKGEFYGSECIKAVTGINKNNLRFIDGEVDLERSIAAKKAEIANAVAAQKARKVEFQCELINYSLRDLLNQLSTRRDDFCDSMAHKLYCTDSRLGRPCLVSDLSPKQQEIIKDIFCKALLRRQVLFLVEMVVNEEMYGGTECIRVPVTVTSREEAESLFDRKYINVTLETAA